MQLDSVRCKNFCKLKLLVLGNYGTNLIPKERMSYEANNLPTYNNLSSKHKQEYTKLNLLSKI